MKLLDNEDFTIYIESRIQKSIEKYKQLLYRKIYLSTRGYPPTYSSTFSISKNLFVHTPFPNHTNPFFLIMKTISEDSSFREIPKERFHNKYLQACPDLQVFDVLGDGNCCVRALCVAEGSKDNTVNWMKIRGQMVTEICDHMEYYEVMGDNMGNILMAAGTPGHWLGCEHIAFYANAKKMGNQLMECKMALIYKCRYRITCSVP